MKLEYLKLTNFRGFREFEITFDPQFTVLLGDNMAGKTAVLEGCAIALGALFIGDSEPNMPERWIEQSEVHRVITEIGGVPDLQWQFPAKVKASIGLRNESFTWEVGLNTGGDHDGLTDKGLLRAAKLLKAQQQDEALDWPVIAQYGVKRTWDETRKVEDIRSVGSRYNGYEVCFNIRSTYARLAGRMRKQTLVQLQRGAGYVQPQMAAIETAVKRCIGDVVRFWFDIQYEELRIERPTGDIQSFDMLSEGYRNTIAMAADIAWRAAALNPHHGAEAHLLTDGIVLIDELDLHLHPSWQRRIVADLRRTFPRIQFVITTHSPQIVASVNRDQVRLLDRNQLVSGKPYVEGRDSSEILEDVFGVTARPEAAKAEIDALFRLIEDEDFVAARQHLAALEERLGPHDAEMVRARWILDTEEAQANRRPAAAP